MLKGVNITWVGRQFHERKGDATAEVRMNSVTTENMKNYHDLLEEILEKHNLKTSPGQIYNWIKNLQKLL